MVERWYINAAFCCSALLESMESYQELLYAYQISDHHNKRDFYL